MPSESHRVWKSCGRHVQKLLRSCDCIFFFNQLLRPIAGARRVDAPSRCASLDLPRVARKISPSSYESGHHIVTAHRFEETIGGRPYLIEVTPVSNRWRAQLLRSPGVPTAMMPFYGQTPDEAARQLTNWLTLAHRRQAPSV
jgi:hypothetical protein